MPNIRLKVSRMMIVEKGDRVTMRVDEINTGYIGKIVEEDGLYIGPDHPIITLGEIEIFLSELRRLRDRRKREKDEELEKKYQGGNVFYLSHTNDQHNEVNHNDDGEDE